jgi:hypothetical protein
LGCDSLVVYNIDLLTHLEQPAWADQLQIGPNPTHDILNISWKGDKFRLEEARIMTVNGKTLQKASLLNANGNKQLTTSQLPNGIYFLELRQGKETHQWTFSKQ